MPSRSTTVEMAEVLVEMETRPLLAGEPDLQALHRAVLRDHGDAERVLDQPPSSGCHVIPGVEKRLGSVLRPSPRSGGPEERLEVRAGAKDDVGANVSMTSYTREGRLGEEAPHVARPEADESSSRAMKPRTRSTFSVTCGAELEAGVAKPLAGEGGLDRALALAVGDVEEHRAAVVKEVERHARSSQRNGASGRAGHEDPWSGTAGSRRGPPLSTTTGSRARSSAPRISRGSMSSPRRARGSTGRARRRRRRSRGLAGLGPEELLAVAEGRPLLAREGAGDRDHAPQPAH